jgi:DNA-binding CsgD family transcriptional regulator
VRFAIVSKKHIDNSVLLLALSYVPGAHIVANFTELGEAGQLCENGEVDMVVADAAVFAAAGMDEPSRQLQSSTLPDLSPREREVLSLLGEGLSNRRISRLLGVTERTTKAHVGSILNKLGVESRLQAGLLARTYLGILEQQDVPAAAVTKAVP